jgi:hypothetical protein
MKWLREVVINSLADEDISQHAELFNSRHFEAYRNGFQSVAMFLGELRANLIAYDNVVK